MGPPVQPPTLSPEQLRLQEQARDLRFDEIQERVGNETRDLLIRFGRSKVMARGGVPGGGSSPVLATGNLGVFRGVGRM